MRIQLERRESDPFGHMLYEGRLRRGENDRPLSMNKAADFFGVTEVWYGKWERGEEKPVIKSGTGLGQLIVEWTGRKPAEIIEALELFDSGKAAGPARRGAGPKRKNSSRPKKLSSKLPRTDSDIADAA